MVDFQCWEIAYNNINLCVAGYATWDICATFLTIFMLFSGERLQQVYSGCLPDADF